jgi:hypothetical protein
MFHLLIYCFVIVFFTKPSSAGKTCDTGTKLCEDRCISENEVCNVKCPEGTWNCDGECIGFIKICNKTRCYPGYTMTCQKTRCEEKPTFYKCDEKCTKINVPCHDKCYLETQINIDGKCVKNSTQALADIGKRSCHQEFINLTDVCDGECARPNWEKNCKGICELQQTFYDCNGTCQPVEQMCNGNCSSLGRPWRCPDQDSNWCVSDYLCSIRDEVNKIGGVARECFAFNFSEFNIICQQVQVDRSFRYVFCFFCK